MSELEAWPVYAPNLQELRDTKVEFGGQDDVTFTHTDWSMTVNLDTEAKEIIFKTVIAPNNWLAIGLANDIFEADIIQWVAGPVSPADAADSNDLLKMIELRD